MSKMKYNVGDMVVEMRNIPLLFNVPASEAKIRTLVSVVQKANDRIFTISEDTDLKDAHNSYERSACFVQRDGMRLSACVNNDRVLHLVSDRELIDKLVGKAYDKVMSREKKEVEDTILRNRKKIQRAVAEIERLEERGRAVFGVESMNEFIEDTKAKIDNVLRRPSL